MENETLLRRDSIILNAIDVINEFGIHSISTKEIAKRMGISEATVFKYFPKKNNLLNAVLEHYSLYDNDIFKTAASKKMQPNEAIIFYIDFYMSYYENYPAITAITQAYDLLKGVPEVGDKVKSIFNSRVEFLSGLVEDAQKTGIISRDIDSVCLSDILCSTCRGMCLKWRMNDFGFPLREKTLNAVNALLDAFSNKSN